MGLPALRIAVDALAKADLPAAKILRDKAVAVEVYLKRSKEAGRIQNQAAEIRLRAERRIGELLRATVKRGNPQWSHGATKGLADLGISKTQSSRWQLIARLPEKVFEEHVSKKRELTTASVLQLAKAHVRAKRRQTGPEAGGNILTGDMAQLWDCLDDDSVDLFLTDPVWDDIEAFARLAELASAKMRPGGLCLAYSGNLRLPEVMAAMGEHLTYYWTFAIRYEDAACAIYPRQLKQKWKPVVGFCKPPITRHEWTADLLVGGGCNKELHKWQQSASEAEYLIERLTERGGLVVDPFCGSGTVLAAAKTMGRKWIGCDVDTGTARIARRRVA